MKQKQTSSILPGILFAVLAVLGIIDLISFFVNGYAPDLLWVLTIAGYALIAFALFTSRRDIILLIGFAICALTSMLSGNILPIAAWVGAVVICFAYLTTYAPKLTKAAKAIWFIPAICVITWQVILVIEMFPSEGLGNAVLSSLNGIVLAFSLLLSMSYVVNPPRKQRTEVVEETAEMENEGFDGYVPDNSGLDVVEELKKYKDLLDSGAISQEEFDAKKKQLLGL